MRTRGTGSSEHDKSRSQSCHADRSKESRRPPLLPTPRPAIRFKFHSSLRSRQRHSCQLRYHEGANGSDGLQESDWSPEPWYHEDTELQCEDDVSLPPWQNEDCSDDPCQGIGHSPPCCSEDYNENSRQGIGYSPPWYNPTTPYDRPHRRGRGFFRVWKNETMECRQGPNEGYGRTRPRYNRPIGWSPRRGRGSFGPWLSEAPGRDQRRREAFPPYCDEPALHRAWSYSSNVGQRRETALTSGQEKPAEKQRSAEKEKPIEQQHQSCIHGAAGRQVCEDPGRQPSAAAKERGTASVYSGAKDSACVRAACASAGKVVPKPKTEVPGPTPRLFIRPEQVKVERCDDSLACASSAESLLGEYVSCVLEKRGQDMGQENTSDLLLARASKDTQSKSLDSVITEAEIGKSLRMSVISAEHQTALGIQDKGLASQAGDIRCEDRSISAVPCAGSFPNGAVVAGDPPSLSCATLEPASPMSVAATSDSSDATDVTEKRQHSAGLPPRPAVVAGGQSSLSCAAHEQPCPLSVQVVDDPRLATDVADSNVSVVDEAQEHTAWSSPGPAFAAGDPSLWPFVFLDQAIPMCVEVVVDSDEPTDATYREACGKDGEPVHSAWLSPRPPVFADDPPSLPCGALEQLVPMSVQVADDPGETTDVTDWVSDQHMERPSPRPPVVADDPSYLPCSTLEQPFPMSIQVADDSSETTDVADWMCDQHMERPSPRPPVVADDPSYLPCSTLEQSFPMSIQVADDSSETTDVADWVCDQRNELPAFLTIESLNSTHDGENTDGCTCHPGLPGKVLLMTQLNEISHVFEGESCTDSICVGEAVSGAYIPGPDVDCLVTAHIDMKIDQCIGGGTEEKVGRFWLESDLEKLDEGWLWSF